MTGGDAEIATGLVLVGAIFLVVLIWWIEARIEGRRTQQLAEGITAPIVPNAIESLPAFAGGVPSAVVGVARGVGPAAPPIVPGPLGSISGPRPVDAFLERSITAAVGSGGAPGEPEPSIAPELEREPALDEAEPEVAPVTAQPVGEPAPEPAAAPGPPVSLPAVAEPIASAPTGPHLVLGAENGRSMMATLDGESNGSRSQTCARPRRRWHEPTARRRLRAMRPASKPRPSRNRRSRS